MNVPRCAMVLIGLICSFSGVAYGECSVQMYRISGSVSDSVGRPLTGAIQFSWQEVHDGRAQTIQTQALAGRYQVEIPFYTQAKSSLQGTLTGGPLYRCDAQLKSVSYRFLKKSVDRQGGAVPISGLETVANLSIRAVTASSGR